MFEQAYDLRSGACLDDPRYRLAVYPVTVNEGIVTIDIRPASSDRQ